MLIYVSPRQRAVVNRAMRFDLRQVRMRYAMDYHATPEDAKILERELKRYLILRALNPTACYPMTGPTDGFWHTFLLFTRKYARFCQQVAGRFLHHTPVDSHSARKDRKLHKDYERFYRKYSLLFEERPPSSVWPSVESAARVIRKS